MSKGRYDSRTASEKSEESGLTRRSLLKSAAGVALGAAAASVIGAKELRAQFSGLYTTNEPPQIPLPMGALTYLDRKQYIHNMEIQRPSSGRHHLPAANRCGDVGRASNGCCPPAADSSTSATPRNLWS